ncbi:Hypothetical protein, putative [Bodo saltans]|uniref:Uncharacterized protein n=1 Tax=Bodo saltans TaxID=75058 RepID=A0A0S4ITW2_BODSA|nr:Hypothetical protein, putative [Bodo saltans]|eukprot:CUG07304.1 Hypothetical protein, putative [Bodo saltans]
MRGIIIVSCTSSVVFHTAPFSRDVVDNIVAIVESDIHVKATADGVPPPVAGGGSASSPPNSPPATSGGRRKLAFQSTLRKASLHRHGGHELVHTARWLEADHKRICEGLLCVYVAEHAWLGAVMRGGPVSAASSSSHATDMSSGAVPDSSGAASSSALVMWRKCGDRVIVFVLDQEESLSLARNAMATLILLLCEAFDKPGSETAPSLKDLMSRPDLVQSCCSCIAPQHLLVMAPLSASRAMLQKLLLSKGIKR